MERQAPIELIKDITHHMSYSTWMLIILLSSQVHEDGVSGAIKDRCQGVSDKSEAVRKRIEQIQKLAEEKGYTDITELLNQPCDL